MNNIAANRHLIGVPGRNRANDGPAIAHDGAARTAGFEAAARVIGVQPAELNQRLREGRSLQELAGEAGVDSGELKSAMAKAIEAVAPPQGGRRLVAGLDRVIAGNRPERPTGSTQDPTQALETLAATLDTDVERLMASIDDGSFRDLLAEKGVEPGLGLLVNTTL